MTPEEKKEIADRQTDSLTEGRSDTNGGYTLDRMIRIALDLSIENDFDKLIEIIKNEHFTPKPQDAAKLSADELLEQMNRLRKKKL